MAQYNDTGYGTVVVTEEVPKSRRVTKSGALASATERDIGISVERGAPEAQGTINNRVITFSYINKQGTQKATLDGAADVDDILYTADDGKVTATQAAGSFVRGIAVESGVDNQVIEILPILAVETS